MSHKFFFGALNQSVPGYTLAHRQQPMPIRYFLVQFKDEAAVRQCSVQFAGMPFSEFGAVGGVNSKSQKSCIPTFLVYMISWVIRS